MTTNSFFDCTVIYETFSTFCENRYIVIYGHYWKGSLCVNTKGSLWENVISEMTTFYFSEASLGVIGDRLYAPLLLHILLLLLHIYSYFFSMNFNISIKI